jgi:hypothetical protein
MSVQPNLLKQMAFQVDNWTDDATDPPCSKPLFNGLVFA